MAHQFPRTTLEQWRVLQAIVEYGSYAQAAKALFRSQSSVSYAVARLQEELGVTLLSPCGRKMCLTPCGEALLHDALLLLEDSLYLEQRAQSPAGLWEAQVNLLVDMLLPRAVLQTALRSFCSQCPYSSLQLQEEFNGNSLSLVERGQVDVAVLARVPNGHSGQPLMHSDSVAVAASSHPLCQNIHALGPHELKKYPQITLNHMASLARPRGHAPLPGNLSVSTLGSAVELVSQGLGYAWLPEHAVADALAKGTMRLLALKSGQRRSMELYLLLPAGERSGPASRVLAQALQAAV